MVKELTNTDFAELLETNKDKLTVVDFYAEWCMPCVMMGPIFEEVSKSHSGTDFAKVNIEDANKLAQDNGVSSIPCFIFFKDGKEVDRIVGGVGEDALKEKIKEHQ